jgi:hypothetical protein
MSRVISIEGVGEYHGIYVYESMGKYYWSVTDGDDVDYKEIHKELYNELIERNKRIAQ